MWFKKSAKIEKITYIATFAIGSIAIIGLQSDRYKKVTTQIENPDYIQQEKDSLTALNLKKITPSFGFENLVADSLYLEFVSYFGDKKGRKATGYSLVTEYFKAIAGRDPQFVEAYTILSVANSMYAGKADETVKIINQIVREIPDRADNSHLLWTLKAMDESMFLGDIHAARFSYEKAAKLALEKDDDTALSTVDYNSKKARFLATKPDTTNAQIIAWKSVLPHIVKEKEKQVIQARIEALEAKIELSN